MWNLWCESKTENNSDVERKGKQDRVEEIRRSY
jgi:hypothetical protein